MLYSLLLASALSITGCAEKPASDKIETTYSQTYSTILPVSASCLIVWTAEFCYYADGDGYVRAGSYEELVTEMELKWGPMAEFLMNQCEQFCV
ncbi:MAG: hypothetical protein FWG02_03100 [Holophagaceae bacterium]|nr:hypothetical protein [Holophagaceae bacterium]